MKDVCSRQQVLITAEDVSIMEHFCMFARNNTFKGIVSDNANHLVLEGGDLNEYRTIA